MRNKGIIKYGLSIQLASLVIPMAGLDDVPDDNPQHLKKTNKAPTEKPGGVSRPGNSASRALVILALGLQEYKKP